MIFHGLQKMTLLDFPKKIACTLFTGGCNFRCPFCHNASLVTDLSSSEIYTEEDILKFLKTRTGLLDGVGITGGEPLMNEDIYDFIIKIKALGFACKVDTNGSYPKLLKRLVNDGLVDYVAMDVKNSKEKYAETIGLKDFDIGSIEESIHFLISQDKIPFEFRTTVVKEFHTVQDIEKIAEWIKGADNYFLQNFVDSGNLIGDNLHEAEKQEMIAMKNAALKYISNTELRGI